MDVERLNTLFFPYCLRPAALPSLFLLFDVYIYISFVNRNCVNVTNIHSIFSVSFFSFISRISLLTSYYYS